MPLVPAAPVPLVPAAPVPLVSDDEPLPAAPPASDEPAGGQSPLIAELPLEGVELAELPVPGGQFADEPPAAPLPSDPLAPLDELLLGELVLGELVLGEVVADESEGELDEEPEGELIEPLDCASAADESASSALAVAAASRLSFMCRDSFRTLWLDLRATLAHRARPESSKGRSSRAEYLSAASTSRR